MVLSFADYSAGSDTITFSLRSGGSAGVWAPTPGLSGGNSTMGFTTNTSYNKTGYGGLGGGTYGHDAIQTGTTNQSGSGGGQAESAASNVHSTVNSTGA
jgi:hypothetical protein